MKVGVVIAVLIAVICMASMASANTSWAFALSANPAVPEVTDNPYGVPSAAINVDPATGTGWYNTLPEIYGTAQGWWDIGTGSIVLTVPDRVDYTPNSFFDVWLEVTYWSEPSGAPTVTTASPFDTLVGKTTTLVEAGPIMGGWYKDVYQWSLATGGSNPKIITIAGDQASGSQIDTVSIVPEPSSMLAAGSLLAGMFGFVRRRRA